MIKRLIILLFSLHAGLSLGGFLLLNSLALAAQDTGSAVGWIAWLEIPLHFVLLQPFAHWVLATATIAWWTWPGLALLTALLAVNSAIFAALAAAVLRRLRIRSRPV